MRYAPQDDSSSLKVSNASKFVRRGARDSSPLAEDYSKTYLTPEGHLFETLGCKEIQSRTLKSKGLVETFQREEESHHLGERGALNRHTRPFALAATKWKQVEITAILAKDCTATDPHFESPHFCCCQHYDDPTESTANTSDIQSNLPRLSIDCPRKHHCTKRRHTSGLGLEARAVKCMG